MALAGIIDALGRAWVNRPTRVGALERENARLGLQVDDLQERLERSQEDRIAAERRFTDRMASLVGMGPLHVEQSYEPEPTVPEISEPVRQTYDPAGVLDDLMNRRAHARAQLAESLNLTLEEVEQKIRNGELSTPAVL